MKGCNCARTEGRGEEERRGARETRVTGTQKVSLVYLVVGV